MSYNRMLRASAALAALAAAQQTAWADEATDPTQIVVTAAGREQEAVSYTHLTLPTKRIV